MLTQKQQAKQDLQIYGHQKLGDEMLEFAQKLWPLNRSLTGEGNRSTLSMIKSHLPHMKIYSYKSGTEVFDWVVPPEWNVIAAYIITPDGEKICDYNVNNLHLVGYSVSFDGELALEELEKNLHYKPEQPDAIPYVTSYYKRTWGFSLSFNQFKLLKPGKYKVVIKAEFRNGHMDYGELIIPGKSEKEIFLSTYICHPSMANNELSGPVVTTFLGKWLSKHENLNNTYRLIFIPETIGSIAYLFYNLGHLKKNMIAGYNISCVGDERAYSYLSSRSGKTLSDRVAKHVLNWFDHDFHSYGWLSRGSDERQYCAPGVDLPVASIMRSKFGTYPEYHTSLDQFGRVVTAKGLLGGYSAIKQALILIERNIRYYSLTTCEPKMDKLGLYPTTSNGRIATNFQVLLDFISYCDGDNDLINIAEALNLPAYQLYDSVDLLKEKNLIAKVPAG